MSLHEGTAIPENWGPILLHRKLEILPTWWVGSFVRQKLGLKPPTSQDGFTVSQRNPSWSEHISKKFSCDMDSFLWLALEITQLQKKRNLHQGWQRPFFLGRGFMMVNPRMLQDFAVSFHQARFYWQMSWESKGNPLKCHPPPRNNWMINLQVLKTSAQLLELQLSTARKALQKGRRSSTSCR